MNVEIVALKEIQLKGESLFFMGWTAVVTVLGSCFFSHLILFIVNVIQYFLGKGRYSEIRSATMESWSCEAFLDLRWTFSLPLS